MGNRRAVFREGQLEELPLQSVRGRIRDFIARHADHLGNDVLEIGSRKPDPKAWWTNNRELRPGTNWLGIDSHDGDGVDMVCDAHKMEWERRFTGVVCSEVLEHCERPAIVLAGMRRALKPGGFAIITTLTAFPLHGYPNDYRRWTAAGLRIDLEDAGFSDIRTETAGVALFDLNDHGERGHTRMQCPIHVFATARC